MERYLPYNPSSTVRVEESLRVKGGKVFLRHIPRQGSVVIEGFVETDSLLPMENQFSCQYALDSLYRDANRVLNFNAAHNGETLLISYIAVGTVFTADDANEIKAHMENESIHGGGSEYDLPTMAPNVKGGAKVGNSLIVTADDKLNVALGTTPLTLEGSMWIHVP